MLGKHLRGSVATPWFFSQDLGFFNSTLGYGLFPEDLGLFMGFYIYEKRFFPVVLAGVRREADILLMQGIFIACQYIRKEVS